MPKVVSEKLLTLAEVVEILESIGKERELTSIETYTLEYAKKFLKISPENARKGVKELVELGVPEEIAVQLINIMPKSKEEVMVILAPSFRVAEKDLARKILEVLDKYRLEE